MTIIALDIDADNIDANTARILSITVMNLEQNTGWQASISEMPIQAILNKLVDELATEAHIITYNGHMFVAPLLVTELKRYSIKMRGDWHIWDLMHVIDDRDALQSITDSRERITKALDMFRVNNEPLPNFSTMQKLVDANNNVKMEKPGLLEKNAFWTINP